MFRKATRSQTSLKLAITGPSGSGKTYSALALAKGLNGRTALIDTENGSASLYAERFDFDTMLLSPPYSTEKYIEGINAAVQAGYEILIIDSISHAWSGEGGLLGQKEQLDSRGGNSYANWAKITPKHEHFIATILHSKIHIIATMRSKQDYILSDKNGKQVPQKVGMAPVQRDGAEYEFTTVLDVAMNHEAQASKDRTGLFDGKLFKIDEGTGRVLREWLSSSSPDTIPGPITGHNSTAHITTKFLPPRQNNPPMSPGDHVVKIGKSYVGRAIKDIPRKDLEGFVKWIHSSAAPNFREGPAAQEFLFYAETFLQENTMTEAPNWDDDLDSQLAQRMEDPNS